MPNMTLTKTPMPEQAPDVRNKNFKRGLPWLHRGDGRGGSRRCLHCKN